MKKFSKIKKEFSLIFIFIIMFLLGLNILYYTNMSSTAYHNLDLAQNMRYLECEFNTTMIDYTTSGMMDSIELWHTGLYQMKRSFVGIFAIGFALGLISLGLVNLYLEHDKLLKTKRRNHKN